MKKVFSMILIVSMFMVVLSGCGKNSVQEQNNDNSLSSDQNSTTSSAMLSYGYLKTDSSKGDAYNAAIKAYNQFLSGEKSAKNNAEMINIKQMNNINGSTGINSYALFDVNKDGIPELHTKSLFYDVFSYKDGQVTLLYEPPLCLMDGNAYSLENGAVFSVHDSTGTFYYYTTFDSDGKASTIAFSDPGLIDSNDVSENLPYFFIDKEVSKEEFDSLTKEYIALSKKPASVEWHEYENNNSEAEYKINSNSIKNDTKHYINYPQLSGDRKDYSNVNNLIKNTVNDYWKEYLKDDLDLLQINYKITLQSDSLISIVFWGFLNYKEAAHPSNLFYTLNIDLNNSKKIKLTDFYSIDKNFADIIRKNWNDQIQAETSESKEDIINMYSGDEFLNQFKKTDNADGMFYSYFTDSKVCISVDVPHAYGDHMEIEIDKNDLAKFKLSSEASK